MGDPDQKNRRRARRKRNLIAKDFRLPKFKHQVKPGKAYERQKDISDDDFRSDEE